VALRFETVSVGGDYNGARRRKVAIMRAGLSGFPG